MTENNKTMSEFPAIATFLVHPLRNSELGDEVLALLNKYTRLKEAVIILDDDAEPSKGDIVIATAKGKQGYGNFVDIERFTPRRATEYSEIPTYRIIQRSGRPCIYRSQITSAIAGEDESS